MEICFCSNHVFCFLSKFLRHRLKLNSIGFGHELIVVFKNVFFSLRLKRNVNRGSNVDCNEIIGKIQCFLLFITKICFKVRRSIERGNRRELNVMLRLWIQRNLINSVFSAWTFTFSAWKSAYVSINNNIFVRHFVKYLTTYHTYLVITSYTTSTWPIFLVSFAFHCFVMQKSKQ
jgi:hypothetical protein